MQLLGLARNYLSEARREKIWGSWELQTENCLSVEMMSLSRNAIDGRNAASSTSSCWPLVDPPLKSVRSWRHVYSSNAVIDRVSRPPPHRHSDQIVAGLQRPPPREGKLAPTAIFDAMRCRPLGRITCQRQHEHHHEHRQGYSPSLFASLGRASEPQWPSSASVTAVS